MSPRANPPLGCSAACGLAVAIPVAVLLSSACGRRAPATMSDAAAPAEVAVRVPAALSVARAIDSLSVAIDPASLGLTHLAVDPGMVLGIEASVFLVPQRRSAPVSERHSVAAGVAFDTDLGVSWSTERDGIPAPGTKYVVEMRLVLFKTDAPTTRPASSASSARASLAPDSLAPDSRAHDSRDWDPHAGRYRVLWERALRQAEE